MMKFVLVVPGVPKRADLRAESRRKLT